MEGVGTQDMDSDRSDLDARTNDVGDGTGERPKEEAETKKRLLPIIIILVICMVIIMIAFPYLLENGKEEIPLYQQFTMIKDADDIVYENGELLVQIIKNGSSSFPFAAEWTDVYDRPMATTAWGSPEELMDDLVYYSEWMAAEQMKWFQYMLTHKVQ